MNRAPAMPRALEAWSNWLGWFDAELAEHLGDLVLRMADLIGPAYATTRAGHDEPDGLGDIRTRGSYERLLASEWVLAEEVPDEFLRRAASSEHLFLSPRMRTPAIERSVIALFDAGPLQWGAPRVAQAAAWILLARRAAEWGGRLRWGLVQQPGVLNDASQVQHLQALLKGRTFKPAGAAEVEAWSTHVAKAEETEGQAPNRTEPEVWWIGADLPAGSPPSPGWRVLKVRPDPIMENLDVSLDGATGRRRARLPLPPDRVGVRILRGDFQPVAVPDTRVGSRDRFALTHAPLLSLRSDHVAVAGLDGHSLLVFAIPQEGRRSVAAPRRHVWSTQRPVIGALVDGRQPGALCASGEWLHFWQLPGFAARAKPPAEVFDYSIATARWLPLALIEDFHVRRLCALDRARRLVGWDIPKPNAAAKAADQQGRPVSREHPDPAPKVLVTEVLGLSQPSTSSLQLVANTPRGLRLIWLWPRAMGRPSEGPVICGPLPAADAALLAYNGVRRQSAVLGGVAVRTAVSPERWALMVPRFHVAQIGHPPPPPAEMDLNAGETGIGLLARTANGLPQLIVLSADRRRLMLRGIDTAQRLLYQAPAPIERYSFDAVRARAALITRERELVVLDARQGTALLVVRGDGSGGDA